MNDCPKCTLAGYFTNVPVKIAEGEWVCRGCGTRIFADQPTERPDPTDTGDTLRVVVIRTLKVDTEGWTGLAGHQRETDAQDAKEPPETTR